MGPKRIRTRTAPSTTSEPTSVNVAAPITAVDEEISHENDEEENTLKSGSDAEPRINLGHQNTIDDEEDDPITREYDVFLNDDLTENLMLLQYPNRERQQPYSQENQSKPTELRWKPNSGIVEVDISMDIFENYDRGKAVRYGDALKSSTEARAGGSLGLAGGFGIGSIPARLGGGGGRASKKDEDDSALTEISLSNFISANNTGRVLNKQTLGGQIHPMEDEKPIYMLGVFQSDQLHLTPIDSIAQLRPQFHHIDADHEQEKSSKRTQREIGNPPRQPETRAIHMTVKAVDDEDMNIVGTTNTLKAAQEEKWTHLDYIDESSDEAWSAYQKLFIKDTKNVPKLESSMKYDEFLDAISASKVEKSRPAKKAGSGKGTREDHGPDKAKPASASKVS